MFLMQLIDKLKQRAPRMQPHAPESSCFAPTAAPHLLHVAAIQEVNSQPMHIERDSADHSLTFLILSSPISSNLLH